jgi:rhodanese-related sulfurtransferase
MLARLMGLETIDPKTLRRRMATEPLAIFDVNSRQSWLEARIPGARHLDPETFLESDLPAERDRELVFYCSNPLCRRAPRAALRAKKMGHTNLRVLSAGITGWRSAGLPTDAGG